MNRNDRIRSRDDIAVSNIAIVLLHELDKLKRSVSPQQLRILASYLLQIKFQQNVPAGVLIADSPCLEVDEIGVVDISVASFNKLAPHIATVCKQYAAWMGHPALLEHCQHSRYIFTHAMYSTAEGAHDTARSCNRVGTACMPT